MKAVCGANCKECNLFKCNKCKGCNNTKGSPFGKKCWIFKYIEIGGKDSFEKIKGQIMEELNSLKIDGMPKIEELYPLHGAFVNLEYTLPNGNKVNFLHDDEAYLGNQVKCEFNDDDEKKYFGLVANMNFLLVCEYGENGSNPEIIIYKRR